MTEQLWLFGKLRSGAGVMAPAPSYFVIEHADSNSIKAALCAALREEGVYLREEFSWLGIGSQARALRLSSSLCHGMHIDEQGELM